MITQIMVRKHRKKETTEENNETKLDKEKRKRKSIFFFQIHEDFFGGKVRIKQRKKET